MTQALCLLFFYVDASVRGGGGGMPFVGSTDPGTPPPASSHHTLALLTSYLPRPCSFLLLCLALCPQPHRKYPPSSSPSSLPSLQVWRTLHISHWSPLISQSPLPSVVFHIITGPLGGVCPSLLDELAKAQPQSIFSKARSKLWTLGSRMHPLQHCDPQVTSYTVCSGSMSDPKCL